MNDTGKIIFIPRVAVSNPTVNYDDGCVCTCHELEHYVGSNAVRSRGCRKYKCSSVRYEVLMAFTIKTARCLGWSTV
jgi:hypothetical protein